MVRINLQNLDPSSDVDLPRLKCLAGKAVSLMGFRPSRVNITLMTSQRIRALNRRYLGKDRATDVIAFPGGDDAFPGVGGTEGSFLGDIAISTDRARVNARAFGESFERELARYIVHGLLHLSGEVDTTPRERAKMKKKEDSILEKAER